MSVFGLFGRKAARRRPDTDGPGRSVRLLIEGMHCTSCGLLIDDELEEVPGVASAATDTRSGHCVVRLEEAVDVDPAALTTAVEAAGEYTARVVG
ncbi:heavy-metal-associated domain-containing protein [Streptomyces sp. NPDC059447]|uniref:heavy-metal-associated domain-containing protein n=1 Tax=Streptomyces sp. NPDC059447 TaxID=3346834 RepID=UPI0036841FB8